MGWTRDQRSAGSAERGELTIDAGPLDHVDVVVLVLDFHGDDVVCRMNHLKNEKHERRAEPT